MYAAWTFREWATVGGLILAAVAILVVAVIAAVGLFRARSLIRREFAALFLSPIAYVVLIVFLVATGYFFSQTLDKLTADGPEGVEYPLQLMYGDRFFWVLFAVIPACLTMRSFAEERASGTLELLMTAPVREWQIVLSKFVASYLFYLLMWVPTLVYLPVLLDLKIDFNGRAMEGEYAGPWMVGGLALAGVGLLLLLPRLGTGWRLASLGMIVVGVAFAVFMGIRHYARDPIHLVDLKAGIDPAPVFTLYAGMALAGAMFMALGLFVSSLVRDQLVAALLSLALSAPFIVAGFFRPALDGDSFVDRVVYFFSVPVHFSKTFSRGLLDTRPVILYASAAAFFLFLTVRSLEGRRWR